MRRNRPHPIIERAVLPVTTNGPPMESIDRPSDQVKHTVGDTGMESVTSSGRRRRAWHLRRSGDDLMLQAPWSRHALSRRRFKSGSMRCEVEPRQRDIGCRASSAMDPESQCRPRARLAVTTVLMNEKSPVTCPNHRTKNFHDHQPRGQGLHDYLAKEPLWGRSGHRALLRPVTSSPLSAMFRL